MSGMIIAGQGEGLYGGYYTGAAAAAYHRGKLTVGTDGSVTMPDGTSYDKNSPKTKALKRTGQVECATCASRKYQDGSDETDVSFKAPGHIAPEASGAVVAAHERQHVANAYESAGREGGKVLQASVTLKMGVCPECGRSYVAGGVTNTMIKYNEENPYSRNAKSYDRAAGLVGSVIDYAV